MENIEEHIQEEDETLMERTGYDAVAIHFRPGKRAEKKIKLVVPGLEPPLLFATITDGPGDTAVIEINDAPDETDSESSEPEGEMLEAEENTAIDNVDENVTPMEEVEPMDAEDIEDAEEEEENMDAMDNIIDDLPDVEVTEEESEDEEEVQDDFAGILIALDSDADQQVIVVRAMEGESNEEAVKRVFEEHSEDYRVGTLEEATDILGHSPLTSKDN